MQSFKLFLLSKSVQKKPLQIVVYMCKFCEQTAYINGSCCSFVSSHLQSRNSGKQDEKNAGNH